MQNKTIIRIAHKGDFPQIAELIAGQNQNPEWQCIHSSIGNGPNDILQVMLKWEEIGEIIFIMARQGDQVVGAMGSEFDEQLGRGWLWGPFAQERNWQTLATALYGKLLEVLPASVQHLTAFLNILNRRGQDFYRRQGFLTKTLAHVYSAERQTMPNGAAQVCPPLAPEHRQDFIDLHSTIFPNAYYSAERVIEQIDENNQVFVHLDKDQVLGYVYASASEDSQEGEIEFLGVREVARGMGIGRLLLKTALKWLFEEQSTSLVTLTVNQENVNARALYESVGFKLSHTGIGVERKLS